MHVHDVTLIAGDGIGPDIADATRAAVEATGARVRWLPALAGAAAVRQSGDPLPAPTLDDLRRTRLALKGPLAATSSVTPRRAAVTLRQALDLYASVRYVRSLRGVGARAEDVDLMVVREASQGFGRGLEHTIDRNTAESFAVVTREGCARFFRFALEHARAHGRKRVALVHRADALRLSSDLWLETARELARGYPRLTFEEISADACALRLAREPSRFDVILTSNLFCDVLGEVATGLCGGPGVVAAASYGDGVAIFEVGHGAASDAAQKGEGNPTALMLSAARLLDHVGQRAAAARLRNAVEEALRVSRVRTPDLGGSGDLRKFTRYVIREIEKG